MYLTGKFIDESWLGQRLQRSLSHPGKGGYLETEYVQSSDQNAGLRIQLLAWPGQPKGSGALSPGRREKGLQGAGGT